jgi:hypothetical protein
MKRRMAYFYAPYNQSFLIRKCMSFDDTDDEELQEIAKAKREGEAQRVAERAKRTLKS